MDEMFRNMSNVAAMLGSPVKMLGGASGANTFSLPSLSATGFAGISAAALSAAAGSTSTAGAAASNSNPIGEKKKGGRQVIADNPNPHRSIEFKSIEQESKNTGRGYYEEESETIE